MTSTTSSKRRRRMAREPKAELAAGQETPSAEENAAQGQEAEAQKGPSKTEKVLVLLKGKQGATLDELVAATGWLPHTARAALTVLKKKGHLIERTKVEGVSRYTLVEAAAA